ncbi:MAG: CHAT domain-containing protein [Blastocatellia bacterium]|nr:CHAT domain-containing protein [Blastocatellia bacterium]
MAISARLLAGLLLFLTLPDLASRTEALAQVDEAEVRGAIQRFFDLYEKGDLEGMLSCWSESAPPIEALRRLYERELRERERRFTPLRFARFKVLGDKVSVRVTTDYTVIRRSGERTDSVTARLASQFQLLREGGVWKIWAQTPALSDLAQALRVARTEADREALLNEEADLVSPELLRLLNGEGDRFYSQRVYDVAMNLAMSARLVSLRLGDKKGLADAWQSVGIIHFVQMRNQPGLDAYHEALKLNQELGRKSEAAAMLTSIGMIQARMGRAAEAIAAHQKALALHEELGEKSSAGQALANIASVHYEQGEYAQASAHYQRSLSWFEAAGAKGALIGRLLQVANVEYEMGNDAAAISFYERAAARAEESGEGGSRGHAFHSIANIHYTAGDYAQASIHYRRSLRAEEAAGNRSGQAAALQGLGQALTLQGHHALALPAYERALEIQQTLGDSTETAAAFSRVGGASFALGLWEPSLDAFRRALALREKLGSAEQTAAAFLDLGLALAAKNDLDGATEAYDRSRALYESIDSHAGIATVLINACAIPFARNEFAKVVEMADRAAEAATRGKERTLYWQARYRAGRAQYRLENWRAARLALQEAIATIEALRKPPAQARYDERMPLPYLAMVDLALAEQKGEEAFSFSERAKALALNGMVGAGKVWINKTMSAREREREGRLLADLRLLPILLRREKQKPQPIASRVADLSARLERARAEYEVFRAQLYRLRPGLKVMRAEGLPITASRAATLLPDGKTALLAFVTGQDKVSLFVYARSGKIGSPLRIYLLGAERAALTQRIEDFARAIAARDGGADGKARELYELLIKPAEPQLAGCERLILLPDEELWGLPFEALRDDGDRFLIERYAISRAPSLTVLEALAPLRRAALARQSGAPLLALSRPEMAPAAIERLEAMRAKPAAPLPEGVAAGAGEVEGVYAAGEMVSLAGTEASEDRLKAEGGNYRILHLTAPAVLHDAAPFHSAIGLASTKEDGILDLREVVGLDWRARLVILSKGEHAGARDWGGPALTGLVWAFHVAGTPAALVARWRTDAPPESLMQAFHRGLREGRPAAIAWQAAVRQAIGREEHRHPFFWAGYQLVGDLR